MKKIALLVAVVLVVAACGGGTREGGPDAIEGIIQVDTGDPFHTEAAVEYPTNPPAGGPHSGQGVPCQFYDGFIPAANVLHSLEHGAVWITYTSEVGDSEMDVIRDKVFSNIYVLASQNDGQDAPIKVTSWGWQLGVQSTDDDRFDLFVDTMRNRSPEPTGPC